VVTILNPSLFLHLLNCSCSNHSTLIDKGGEIVCENCNKEYSISNNILEFVEPLELDVDTLRELKANTYDLTQQTINHMANKDSWSNFYSHFANKKSEHLMCYLEKIESDQIFSLGTGTGFELRKILSLRKYNTVYASDLSYSALRIVPHSINQFDVRCGLFTSDLENCPITWQDIPIIIYEALHHTKDLHLTIEKLLIKNYNNILFVEPSTNFIIQYLTKMGLAQREEYSGLKPKWLELKKLRKLCRRHGYEMFVTTMWEIPEEYFRKFYKKEGLIQAITLFLIDVISGITNLLKIGSFSICYLKKK
jgi:hypothetical protein